jgi:F420-non-reducing hydrogenase iron-sulfur subunit
MAAHSMGNGHKILILATLSGGYRGADAVGQAQLEYAPNTCILPVLSAAMFPEQFYLDAFDRGFDGILVMYSGTDCPYEGAAERTAQLVNGAYERMKERGLDTRRLRLTAICTVCVRPFLEEVQKMNRTLDELEPIARARPNASPQTA